MLCPLQCGAKILFASDDFFAAAEGMLQHTDPIFIADKFTGLYTLAYSIIKKTSD